MSQDLPDFNLIPDPLAGRARAVPALAPASPAGPSRSVISKRRWVAITVGLVWLLATPLIWGYRLDIPTEQLVLHVGVPTALGVIALLLAFSRGRNGLGPGLVPSIAFAVAAPLVFVAASLMTPCFDSASTVAWTSFLCGDVLLVLALLPLGLLAWAQRRSFAASAGVRSMLVGGAVGLVAAGFQALHCVHTDGFHVAIGHGWPVIVLGLLGGLVVGRVARV